MNYGSQLERLNAAANAGINHLDPANVPDGQIEAAQFDIIVTRLTAAIAEVLPFPLFGAATLESGLQQDVGNYLASSNTSLVGIQYGMAFIGSGDETITPVLSSSNKLRLQYKNGSDLDIIEITCTSVPYPQFVQSTFSDIFTLNKIRMTISDSSLVNQFSQQMVFTRKSIFGKFVSNPLTATAFSSPFQLRTDIVDVNVNDNVDKETAIWCKILATADFSITYSVFVQKYTKLSARF